MANNKAFKIKNGLLAGRYLGSNGTETAGTVGYNLAGASYDSKSFSVAAQDTVPQNLFFKPDGTKMYAVGSNNDTVYQYTLSTTWDITTASYDSVSFSVASQEATPQGLFFKSDGTKMYISGSQSDAVYQYTLSTAWDLSTASYDSVSFSISGQTTSNDAIYFKDDGTAFYASNGANDTIYQYTLSTAWDLSTASYSSKSFSTASQDTISYGVTLSSSGTKLFVMGLTTTPRAIQYTLSTAWDISTASYDGLTFSITQDTVPTKLIFKPDGTKMYVLGTTNDTVYQYSTASYTQSLDLSTGDTFSFTPSGATTVSFTNPPASGLAIGFTLEVINTGGYTLTWPSSVKWHLATTPTATATKEVYTFITTDGGTTYYGKKAGENLA